MKKWKPSEDAKLRRIVRNASSVNAGLELAVLDVKNRTISACRNRWQVLNAKKRSAKAAKKLGNKPVVHNRVPQDLVDASQIEKEAFYVDTITLLLKKLSNNGKLIVFKKLYEL